MEYSIYHYTADRVRAHVFLCMLAYYVDWHMREKLKPLLFDDKYLEQAEALRTSVVVPAEVSLSAKDKARRKKTAGGFPPHSFRSLLENLATLTKNRAVPWLPGRNRLKCFLSPLMYSVKPSGYCVFA